ncbi:MAG: SdpI family protein [Verrucomicrobiota bacterium]
MNPETYAFVNIGIAILISGLSIPLILRKVPMNHFYGVRFPQSFKSEEAWFEINEYGGKALLVSALPIFLSGVYGLIQKPENFFSIGTAILVISPMTSCLISYSRARQIDHENNG